MAASSSSHSASEAPPSSPDSTWAHEPWFLEHTVQAEHFELERRYYSASLQDAGAEAEAEPQARDPTSPSLEGPREGATEYYDDDDDDSSSDSSDTDSLASAKSASSARRQFEALMSNARQLATDLVEATERRAAFELERDTGDPVGSDDEDEEPLPRYERVETLPPSYEAAVAAVEEPGEEEQEPQLQQVAWMQEMGGPERWWRRQWQRQRSEEQERGATVGSKERGISRAVAGDL